MSEEINKKPKVFPTPDLIAAANDTGSQIAKQLEIENKIVKAEIPEGERIASEKMKAKTETQLRKRDELLEAAQQITDPKLREEAIRKAYDSIKEVRPELAENKGIVYEVEYGDIPKREIRQFKAPLPTQKPSMNNSIPTQGYEKISEPQYDALYDVIPLPSKGKLYPNKKPTMKVAYLNASDENILTNPNLLENGKFLEVLFNRKMLETNLKYSDLHIGDRNAIMIWLRSTGYGPQYPISLYDPATGQPFETEIDLTKLKMVELEVETDDYGHIAFQLPSNNLITFKLLTVGDIDDIDEHDAYMKEKYGPEYMDTATYTLKKQIQSVNGVYDKEAVSKFVDRMMLLDVKEFRKYVNEVESGIDMNLSVRTPGGESIKTFLPLNISFFWPDLRV